MSDSANPPETQVIYLLMAGGSGKRLWPSSRRLYPKPLFRPLHGHSLIGESIKLLSSVGFSSEITVLVGARHEQAFRSHLASFDTGSARVGLASEPLSRNTAPAIALGVMRTLREFEEDRDAIFVVSPSDHCIENKERFRDALKTAISAAEEGLIVTVGVEPTRPETGYGYIQKGAALQTDAGSGKAFKIGNFVEKPDIATARKYLKDSFLWNCGIFVFKGRVMMREIKKHAPKVFSAVSRALSKEDSFGVPDSAAYARSPDISIDFAVMEKTDLGAVVPASFEWSDVGSWQSVHNLAEKNKDGNAVSGDVVLENSQDCLVRGGNRLIVGEGLKHIAVIDEGDALLVTDINSGREVRNIVDSLIRRKRPEAVSFARSEHGWGSEEIVEKGPGFSVKKISVTRKMEYKPQNSNGRIVVLEGGAAAFVADETVTLSEGDLLETPDDIPVRIKNTGDSALRILEISFETDG